MVNLFNKLHRQFLYTLFQLLKLELEIAGLGLVVAARTPSNLF
jgi:hypothetical protein